MSNTFPNKRAVAEIVCQKTGLDQKEAIAAIDATLEAIKTIVKKDGAVCFQNFGTFKKVVLKARKQRNPQTGEIMDLPSKNKVGFSMAKSLKEHINS